MRANFIKISFSIVLLTLFSCSRTIEEKEDVIVSGTFCDTSYYFAYEDRCLSKNTKYLVGSPGMPCFEDMIISFPDTALIFSNRQIATIYGDRNEQQIIPIDFKNEGYVRFITINDCPKIGTEIKTDFVLEIDMRGFEDELLDPKHREVLFITYNEVTTEILDSVYVEFSPLNF